MIVMRARRNPAPTKVIQVPKIEVRCEFTELFTSQCAHCLGIEADWLPARKVEVYEGSI